MQDLKKSIAEICHKLYEHGYLVATSGNVSTRTTDGFLITPTYTRKDKLTQADIVECNKAGKALTANTQPSSEVHMHKFIYERRPDINAAIHAHPPFCVSCTVLGIEVSDSVLPEVNVYTGPVPTVPYVKPGTLDQANAVLPYIIGHKAMLLKKHGVLVLGKTIEDAFNTLEQLEYIAKITYLTRKASD